MRTLLPLARAFKLPKFYFGKKLPHGGSGQEKVSDATVLGATSQPGTQVKGHVVRQAFVSVPPPE